MRPTVWPGDRRFLDLTLSAVREYQERKGCRRREESAGSEDTNFRVVPLGHLVALFEIVNDVRPVRATGRAGSLQMYGRKDFNNQIMAGDTKDHEIGSDNKND
jgi:hypothetical protein